MKLDERALPLTPVQLGIWLSQEIGGLETEWQVSQFVVIDGWVDPDLLKRAIWLVVGEAEPARAAFFQRDGQIVQRTIDDPDFEVAYYDLTGSDDPVREAYRLGSLIQQTPMSFTGPLFKFALFQTRGDQFYLFICCHHLVVDGFGSVLCANRIASVYSALASGMPVPPAIFGSLSDMVGCELEYEASREYREDLAYWRQNLPTESVPSYGLPAAVGGPESCTASAPVQLDPAVVRRVDEFSAALGIRRSSVISAACALIVHGWCGGGSEVVLDFPVSRRTTPELMTFPGAIAGVVPLVVQISAQSAVGDFCQHVHTRIRETMRHQRFPVQSLGDNRASNRVGVNFLPSITILPFDGAPAELVPVEVLKNGRGVPLFCLPPAGGVSWQYRALGSYVDCPIIGLQQIPNNEAPRSVRDSAKNYADTIQALHPDGPYRLLGWSFGGTVAHELAIELRRRGCVVAPLLLLDARPVLNAAPAPLTYEQGVELLQRQAPDVSLPSRQLGEALLENINRNALLGAQHMPDIFDGDMIIFSATRDGDGSPLLQRWRPYVAGNIVEHPVDCTHNEMLAPQSLDLFGRTLGDALA